MFHYLYKTTCLVTDNWYIGIHSTDNLFDGYLGSGTRLQRSVEKYGAGNHDRVWLEFFDSREEAFAREVEVVTQELIDSDLFCMNIKPGGSGGWSKEEQSRGAISANEKMNFLRQNDAEWTARESANRSKAAKEAYKNGTSSSKTFSEWLKTNPHQKGSKNSQYGTCWVSNNVHTIKIKLELLDEYISKGYIRGRKLNTPH